MTRGAGSALASSGQACGAALSHAQTTALWTASFLGELVRCGVRDVVVSPGSRSTALAMTAYEISRRHPQALRLWVDVDERGASFFGLGMAKASGRPVALICTSGTALANYYPAIIEAETSRVPLIVLSGDRPPRLQGLGAPQTTDQLKAYGDHVRAFRAMPLPAATVRDVAFARQAAREACLAALGGASAPCGVAGAPEPSRETQVASRACERMAGPVQVNFPFEEPLKPDFRFAAFDEACARLSGAVSGGRGRCADGGIGAFVGGSAVLDATDLKRLEGLIVDRRALVLAGEGTCSTLDEAREVAAWAGRLGLPLLADPLSGLRSLDEAVVIDNYDNLLGRDTCPLPDVVIRFGRWPVSKRATTRLAACLAEGTAHSVVVDAGETRDFNCATDVFVRMTPLEFVRSAWEASPGDAQRAFFRDWTALNDEVRPTVLAPQDPLFEGSYVSALLDEAPAGSCVFTANSMAVRAVDTFYVKSAKPLCVMANRGQNGIDGTVSTAIGAAQHFAQTTFLTGDFTLLHDMGALALQREVLGVARGRGEKAPSAVVVLVNNNGGAIFDMLPQASDDPSFERLFLAPQDVSFADAARAFGVPYALARSVEEFRRMYRECVGRPGISIVEVRTPLRGVSERYGAYQR